MECGDKHLGYWTVSNDENADNTMTVNIGGHAYTVDIKANEKKDFAVEIPSNTEYANNDISITFGTTWIDNVFLLKKKEILLT